MHQVVTAYRNAGRAGTKAQLTKAEVRGGGRKPRPQKGGGTSRAGSIRSPIWVGGGRAFAAKPRDFAQKVNKKMYRGAHPVDALGARAPGSPGRDADAFTVDAPKTKLVAEQLKKLKLEHVLIIVEGIDEKLFLAARNLPHVEVLPVAHAEPAFARELRQGAHDRRRRETHRGAPAMSPLPRPPRPTRPPRPKTPP